MNKAIQDQLAPGSTFKIIMSAAGLQEGVAQDMHVNCVGGGDFYGRFFHCDKHHGVLNIHQAIPLVLRHVLLHPGAAAGHRHDRQVRHLVRLVAEDRHRPAQRDVRRHALHQVGDEELPPEVLRRQHHLGRHRPGRNPGHAHSACCARCPASPPTATSSGRTRWIRRPASRRLPPGGSGLVPRLGRQRTSP